MLVHHGAKGYRPGGRYKNRVRDRGIFYLRKRAASCRAASDRHCISYALFFALRETVRSATLIPRDRHTADVCGAYGSRDRHGDRRDQRVLPSLIPAGANALGLILSAAMMRWP